MGSTDDLVTINRVSPQLDGCQGFAHKVVGTPNDVVSLERNRIKVSDAKVNEHNSCNRQSDFDGLAAAIEELIDLLLASLEEVDHGVVRLFHVVVLLASYPTSLGLWALILFEYSTANQHWPLATQVAESGELCQAAWHSSKEQLVLRKELLKNFEEPQPECKNSS